MEDKKGILYGIGAYLLWGLFPIYFKALQSVPALEILYHRIVWSFLFLAVVLALRQDWGRLRRAVNLRLLASYTLASVLLAANWLIYIFGVNSGQILEASLGYFINPLFSVLLGVVFLRERLRAAQWLPVALATAGVLYLTAAYGRLPWIALALAFSFGMYGLVKKVTPLSSLPGLTLETAILFVPALVALIYLTLAGKGAFLNGGWNVSLLLSLAGFITALPLLLFAGAARRIPLWMVGLLQYLAPTMQFLLGVLVYDEPFTQTRLIGFAVIWLALVIFTLESFWTRRRALNGLHALTRERTPVNPSPPSTIKGTTEISKET